MNGDFSESRVEDAAAAFNVSEQTVSLQLSNNFSLPWQDIDYEHADEEVDPVRKAYSAGP